MKDRAMKKWNKQGGCGPLQGGGKVLLQEQSRAFPLTEPKATPAPPTSGVEKPPAGRLRRPHPPPARHPFFGPMAVCLSGCSVSFSNSPDPTWLLES